MFLLSQLWLTTHPRGTADPPDTGTPGTRREIHSEDADDGLSNQQWLSYKPSAPAIALRALFEITCDGCFPLIK